MRARKSAQRLPRYVRSKLLSGGKLGYFFDLPTWVRDPRRQPPCPVGNEPLGADRDAAIKRAEDVLLPAFDAWLSNGDSPAIESAPGVARFGTLDWLFGEYRKSPRGRFNKLSAKQSAITKAASA